MKEINGDVFFLCGLEEYVDDSNEKFVQIHSTKCWTWRRYLELNERHENMKICQTRKALQGLIVNLATAVEERDLAFWVKIITIS